MARDAQGISNGTLAHASLTHAADPLGLGLQHKTVHDRANQDQWDDDPEQNAKKGGHWRKMLVVDGHYCRPIHVPTIPTIQRIRPAVVTIRYNSGKGLWGSNPPTANYEFAAFTRLLDPLGDLSRHCPSPSSKDLTKAAEASTLLPPSSSAAMASSSRRIFIR